MRNINRLSHTPSGSDTKRRKIEKPKTKTSASQSLFVVAPVLVGNLYKAYWGSFRPKDCGAVFNPALPPNSSTSFMKVTTWVRILLFLFVEQGFGLDCLFRSFQVLKMHNPLLFSASLFSSPSEEQQALLVEPLCTENCGWCVTHKTSLTGNLQS